MFSVLLYLLITLSITDYSVNVCSSADRDMFDMSGSTLDQYTHVLYCTSLTGHTVNNIVDFNKRLQ